jgi:hypothetical protein
MQIGGVELQGQLDDSPLAARIWDLLPFECHGETWGEEVYFPVQLEDDNPDPVDTVKVGDIAYWPDGPDLCVFFGRTPKSTDDTPVVASPVTVVGTFGCDPTDFRMMRRERRGIPVRLGRVEVKDTPPEPAVQTEPQDDSVDKGQ